MSIPAIPHPLQILLSRRIRAALGRELLAGPGSGELPDAYVYHNRVRAMLQVGS